MTDSWRPVQSSPLQAVAIFNYNVAGIQNGTKDEPDEDSPWHLTFFVGDSLIVLEECKDWFFGHSISNSALCGIFPKSYVHLANGYGDSKVLPPIVAETTAALREWNTILRQKFLEQDNEKLKLIQAIMREVMTMRSSLVASKMTMEEAKETRQKVTTKMDFLNHRLGLDLIVRDANGLVLTPERTSAVSLYRQHVVSSEKIKTMLLAKPRDEVEMTNSFKIMLTLNNFVSTKLTESVDLIISIYEFSEGKTPKPLCENYIVENWNRNPKDPEDRNNLRVQFGDISKNDITNKRLFLICNVVSEGNFCGKTSTGITSSESDRKSSKEINFRKPVGVAAIEITELFTFKQGKTTQGGLETEHACPFLAGNESESWESTFRKLVNEKKVNEPKALWVKIGIVFGDAAINVMEHHNATYSYHHSILTNRTLVARKLGLPEVILPSDVRNDLYINLIGGEFSRLDKRQDRNIEATVEVCDAEGKLLEDCLSGGVAGGGSTTSRYHTVVYYHDGKPRWNEVVRVTVPADLFAGTHLRFTFRHRSRNDAKEKSAPWAMSFLKLVSDSDGTAVRDATHDLLIYKLDKKYEPDNDSSYLKLPHLKIGQAVKQSSKQNGSAVGGLTLLPRDVFTVQTTLASTKLTQNEGLLSLLKWKSEPDHLGKNLQIFNQKVNGNEFVKFMPDVLDALFSILMENTQSEVYDQKVFKSLVNVIHMITEDAKYQQFIPVLELYINENFYATLAYNKLLIVLRECVENGTLKPVELTQTMKCLRYVFKFVVRSRMLCSQLNNGKGQEPFEQHLKDVLNGLVKLMFSRSQDLFQAQAFCLKHMVASLPDLSTVYEAKNLAETLMKMLASLPQSHLSEIKIQTIKEIVHSQLFLRADCRAAILPRMVTIIREFLETDQSSEQGKLLVKICTQTLGDILDALQKYETSSDDISVICEACLRTVIQSVANRKKDDENIQAVVANMISIFRKMGPGHYDQYIYSFNVNDPAGRCDLIDFVMEVLGMFRDLLQNSVFPSDWNTMIMLQNAIILKALCQVSHTIRDHLSSPFESQAWSNFFQCAITFITQPSLQVEKFSETKKLKILGQYKDMRKEMGLEVRQMWFNLGHHKIDFVPDMVGHFLEMTLIPETELRKATIPIFFDMMQCEYYSSRIRTATGEHYDTRRDSSMIKGNFAMVENELITKLDTFVAEFGCGDEHYLFLFRSIMLSHCESHTLIKETGTAFVKMTSRLMELLLEYRTISQQESKENQMSCCVHLLDFYHEIDREELYVKYLKKLSVLHEQCHNWAEAGFAIKEYTNLLKWTDDPLTYSWKRHSSCRTHKSLKENLYQDIVDNFEKGKMWEMALQVCKELAQQYEEVTFEYPKLANLLTRMSKFYDSIMTELRPQPEYFRVAFYGRGFPAFLQNKVFIYRGRGFERLPDFQARMLDQFPNAELMTSLQPPTQDEMESPNQLLQINAVDPVMEQRPSFLNKSIHPQILSHFKANEVHTFSYSRPYHKVKDKENEFASLWIERTVLHTRSSFPGILQWFPIIHPPNVYELCPLEVAIETMQKANEDLKTLVTEHQNGKPPLNPLSMKLNGIIDAAVMGGTANYERAFFTDNYLATYPEHKKKVEDLKNLLADQVPLLHIGIRIHAMKKSDDLKPFHERLETMFNTMRLRIEECYGKRNCDITLKRSSNESVINNEGRHSPQVDSNKSVTDNGGSHNRLTLQSQSSIESSVSTMTSYAPIAATPKSRVLSVIGIARKRSNATSKEEKSARSSFNSQTSLIRESSPDTATPPRGLNGGGSGQSKQDQQRLCVVGSGGSRPSSGQFLLTSTPNHSRSPSIASNRDSIQSNDGSFIQPGVLDPPPVPPKSRSDNLNNDELSITDSYLENTAHVRKKKAPPPPPPTPPKKPPLKLFE